MAFEEDIAATVSDLLEAFCDFAVTNAGFTRIANKTITTPEAITDMYILQRGGIYWYFYGTTGFLAAFGTYGEIWCRMMLVEPTDANQLQRDLGPYYRTKCSLFSRPNGPYVKHRFYSDGNHVNMVLEITPGAYTHMAIGKIDPFFTFTGGEYINGSHAYMPFYSGTTGWGIYPSAADHICYCESEHGAGSDEYNNDIYGYGAIYLPLDPPSGVSSDFAPQYGDTLASSPNAYGRKSQFGIPTTIQETHSMLALIFSVGDNLNINNRAILWPNYVSSMDNRAVGNTGDSFYYGHVDTCRGVNMTNLVAEQIVEVEWDVYPIYTKGGDRMSYPDSNVYGLAFKRIP